MAEPKPNTEPTTQTQPTEPTNQPAQIDYEKLASIVSGKQTATEDSVLKGYFKQQGLSGEEMQQAIATFKEQKVKNTPDVSKLQNDVTAERSARLQAVVNQNATLEAIKQGIDVKSIPYLLKMADFSAVTDDKGNINAEKLTEAVKKVLEDIPALKGADGENSNNGIQKIGGDGNGNGAGQPPKPETPTKRWNRFN